MHACAFVQAEVASLTKTVRECRDKEYADQDSIRAMAANIDTLTSVRSPRLGRFVRSVWLNGRDMVHRRG